VERGPFLCIIHVPFLPLPLLLEGGMPLFLSVNKRPPAARLGYARRRAWRLSGQRAMFFPSWPPSVPLDARSSFSLARCAFSSQTPAQATSPRHVDSLPSWLELRFFSLGERVSFCGGALFPFPSRSCVFFPPVQDPSPTHGLVLSPLFEWICSLISFLSRVTDSRRK